MKEKNENKTSKLASIRVRCILLVIGCVVISAGVCFATIVPKFSSEVSSETKTSMLQLSTAYGKLVQKMFASSGGMVETSQIQILLEDVKVRGMKSSHFYLVNSEGIMLYHPDATKVGAAVDCERIQQIVDAVKAGNIPDPEIITYKYDGKTKYAAYYISAGSKNILVVSVNKEDINSSVNRLTRNSFISEIIISLILVLLGFLVSCTITKPIKKLCKLLQKSSKLDFTIDNDMDKLIKRKDEFGEIAREYQMLQHTLADIVHRIGDASSRILQSSDDMIQVVSSVNEHSQDNSATSQELAAGMEETAATVDTIDSNITTIQDNTKEINNKTILGTELANEIKKRADELEMTTNKAIEQADSMFETVQVKSNKAIEQSKAVDKINVLSNTIMEIADETALLSLNASIEAARAGEMGRGFGVVAKEISKLASQSADTVAGISEIVNEVQNAVNNMSECLAVTMEFFEENVRKDYFYFKETSSRYNKDASSIQNSMDNIHTEMNQLSIITDQISTAISGIAATVNESTVGVTDIAGKTTDIVGLISETGEKINVTKKYSEDLQSIMNQFKL